MSDKNLNRWFIALALAGGLIIVTDSRADSVPPRVSQWPVGLDMGALSPVPTDDAHNQQAEKIEKGRLQRLELKCRPMYPDID